MVMDGNMLWFVRLWSLFRLGMKISGMFAVVQCHTNDEKLFVYLHLKSWNFCSACCDWPLPHKAVVEMLKSNLDVLDECSLESLWKRRMKLKSHSHLIIYWRDSSVNMANVRPSTCERAPGESVGGVWQSGICSLQSGTSDTKCSTVAKLDSDGSSRFFFLETPTQ